MVISVGAEISPIKYVYILHHLDVSCYKEAQSKYGPSISWYKQLKDVPQGFSCFIAHEFFDALPIHKFQVRHDLGITIVTVHYIKYHDLSETTRRITERKFYMCVLQFSLLVK